MHHKTSIRLRLSAKKARLGAFRPGPGRDMRSRRRCHGGRWPCLPGLALLSQCGTGMPGGEWSPWPPGCQGPAGGLCLAESRAPDQDLPGGSVTPGPRAMQCQSGEVGRPLRGHRITVARACFSLASWSLCFKFASAQPPGDSDHWQPAAVPSRLGLGVAAGHRSDPAPGTQPASERPTRTRRPAAASVGFFKAACFNLT